MSSVDDAPSAVQPPAPKKQSRWLTIFIVVAGLIGIVGGASQFFRGVYEIMGAKIDSQTKQLLDESDQAVVAANKEIEAGATPFQDLMNDIDKRGLDAVRKDKSDAARQISDHFSAAAAKFRFAAGKGEEAVSRVNDEKLKAFLADKAKAFGLYAEAFDENQKIVAAVLDPAVATNKDLLAKMDEIVPVRDAKKKAADEASAAADAMVPKKQPASDSSAS